MRNLIAPTCALVAIICLVLSFQNRPARAGVDEIVPRKNFEYATLFREGSAAGWRAPGENQSAAKTFDLYRQLGGKEVEKFYNTADLLSLIGRQGWELVTVTDDTKGSVAYYFKRPI